MRKSYVYLMFSMIILLLMTCSSNKKLNSNLYNVKDFGAKGNGLIDDSYFIQRCFDYIGEIGGGTAYFPKGTYVVSRSALPGKVYCLSATSNLKIKGEDAEHTIIKLAPLQKNYTRILYIEKVKNVDISNITFYGSAEDQDNPEKPNEHLAGIFMNSCQNVVIKNCQFIKTGGDGITIRGPKFSSKNILIDSCYFNGCNRNGVTLGSGFDGVKITNNYFGKNIDDSPIDTEPHNGICQNVLIDNNEIYTPTILTVGGSSADNKGKNFIITNNKFYDCGIFMTNAEDVFIKNNTMNLYEPKKDGITVLGSNYNILIDSNDVKIAKKNAIYIVKTRYSKEAPNKINIVNNEITLEGSGLKVISCAGGNEIDINNNLFMSKEFYENQVGYFFSNYPMKNIKISNNKFLNFSKGLQFNALKTSLIEDVFLDNNSLNGVLIESLNNRRGLKNTNINGKVK